MQTRIELLVRADDVAGGESANRAVAQCVESGLVRNVSVMAIGSALRGAAERFARHEGIAVGLHVALNSEWHWPRYRPVLPADRVRSLVGEDGCFLRDPMRLQERGFVLKEALAEVEAQLVRLREVGFEPTYLDEHMGVGWLAGLGELLQELARREGLVYAARDARPLPILPVSDGRGVDTLDRWVRSIESVPRGRYVLVTHPLFDDEESRAIHGENVEAGRIASERDRDRRMLRDARLIAACNRADVRLCRYGDAGPGFEWKD